jgi:DNA-directed RNA polymerase subunit RPC12/RpoP
MRTSQGIHFQLFQMPCCGQLLCWVNPRLPNHCPECGTHVLVQLKSGEHTRVNDYHAVLRMDSEKI